MKKAKPNAAPAEAATASNVTSISAAKGKAKAPTADIADENTASSTAPAIVVFGKDEAGKVHASRFGEADVELAIKAAGLMGYHVLRVTSADMGAKAQELPAGRIFASGKGFVPFCKMPLYEALCGFDGAFQPPAPAEPEPLPALAVTGTPQRWEEIGIGSAVLASTGPDEGWFEAVVAEDRGDALFVLRWKSWPDHDPFVRRADGLALLPAPPTAASASA